MINIDTSGKSGKEAVNLVKAKISGDDELKILIDGPSQADAVKNFLVSQGFDKIILEDDDGILFITASKISGEKEKLQQDQKEDDHEEIKPEPETKKAAYSQSNNINIEPRTTAIIISCDNRKYKSSFMNRFLFSLVQSKAKPNVIALMNGAVKFAVYSSETCEHLKELEAAGVNILISGSCADRLRITEAAGAGIIIEMSALLEKVYECERIISI